MADIGPNKELHKKRLEVHLSEMKLSKERMELRRLEVMDELRKIEENMIATNLDIKKTQEQLDQFTGV